MKKKIEITVSGAVGSGAVSLMHYICCILENEGFDITCHDKETNQKAFTCTELKEKCEINVYHKQFARKRRDKK